MKAQLTERIQLQVSERGVRIVCSDCEETAQRTKRQHDRLIWVSVLAVIEFTYIVSRFWGGR